MSKHGADLAFSGLALDWGPGRITGSGGIRGEALSLSLDAANLPIGSAARLAGQRHMRGTLGITASMAGTVRAPRGRLSVTARDLTVASSRHSRLTGLGLAADGDWNGRTLDLNGRVTGLDRRPHRVWRLGSAGVDAGAARHLGAARMGGSPCGSRAPGKSSIWPICCRSARTG